jgi:prepilin-type N-terminal cleavage/methylation domain-containing protein
LQYDKPAFCRLFCGVTMHLNSKKFYRGFTLLEFVLTIVIIGILATAATVVWPSDLMKINGQAQGLISDIRYLQMQAMARHEMLQINFSSSQYSLTVTSSSAAVNFPGENNNIIVLENNISASASINTLIFDSTGTPYTNSSTPLNTNATITISSSQDSSSATVTIIPETGYVSIS